MTTLSGDWYYKSRKNAKHHIHGFQASGEWLNWKNIHQLVSAMATFNPNDGSTDFGVTASTLPESVQIAVNQAWKG